MYRLTVTTQFEKDYKRCLARNLDVSILDNLILFLEKAGTIDEKLHPHPLKGKYLKHWECHIMPDWLLIWLPNHTEKEIRLVRTGTHSDLF